MNVRDIQVREFEDTKTYFPDAPTDVAFLATALAGEVGETCNIIKKHLRGDFIEEGTATALTESQKLMFKLHDELPDILIYLVMLATAAGVDLERAYEDKKRINDERFGHPRKSATV